MHFLGENLVNEIGRVSVIFIRVFLKVLFLTITVTKSLNVTFIFAKKS